MSKFDQPAELKGAGTYQASRPARVRLHWPTFFRCHPKGLLISVALHLLAFAVLPFNLKTGLAILAPVFINSLIAIDAFAKHAAAGDLNLGIVLSRGPDRVAVLADMTMQHDRKRLAVQVFDAPLSRGTGGEQLSPGDFVPVVCSYGDDDKDAGVWTKLYPYVVHCLTPSHQTIERCESQFRHRDRDMLEAALAQVPRPFEPGLTSIVESELMLDSQYSENGDPIAVHEAAVHDFEPAFGDEQTIDEITRHIEHHIGPIEFVFHEMVSDLVHIDLHVVAPDIDRPYYTVVTSGMSDRPMAAPEGLEEFAHCELLTCLPEDWVMDQEEFDDENHYWPLRWLKHLARFPHQHSTWLFEGHTVPNGDPPRPFSESTELCCCLMVSPMVSDSEEFSTLKTTDGRSIHFLQMIPLYEEEMELKLGEGFDALLEHFEEHDVPWVIDTHRENSAVDDY